MYILCALFMHASQRMDGSFFFSLHDYCVLHFVYSTHTPQIVYNNNHKLIVVRMIFQMELAELHKHCIHNCVHINNSWYFHFVWNSVEQNSITEHTVSIIVTYRIWVLWRFPGSGNQSNVRRTKLFTDFHKKNTWEKNWCSSACIVTDMRLVPSRVSKNLLFQKHTHVDTFQLGVLIDSRLIQIF